MKKDEEHIEDTTEAMPAENQLEKRPDNDLMELAKQYDNPREDLPRETEALSSLELSGDFLEDTKAYFKAIEREDVIERIESEQNPNNQISIAFEHLKAKIGVLDVLNGPSREEALAKEPEFDSSWDYKIRIVEPLNRQLLEKIIAEFPPTVQKVYRDSEEISVMQHAITDPSEPNDYEFPQTDDPYIDGNILIRVLRSENFRITGNEETYSTLVQMQKQFRRELQDLQDDLGNAIQDPEKRGLIQSVKSTTKELRAVDSVLKRINSYIEGQDPEKGQEK